MLRAYHVAGRPAQTTRLGSFGEWSDLVRSALMWLGRADPVETIEKARADDPKLEKLRSVLVQWHARIGSEAVSANDAAQRASEKSGSVFEGGKMTFVNPEFREALLAVAGANGFIDTGKLGTWLGRNKGRVVEGMHIAPEPMSDGVKKWSLVSTKQASDQDFRSEPRNSYAEARGDTHF